MTVPPRDVPLAAPSTDGGTEVRLSDVLAGLSVALDLTEGQRPGHAVRTCAIGIRLAEEIGPSRDQRSALFYALLMKDLGCSSNASRFAALFAADDQTLKASLTQTDWSKPLESFRFVARSVAPGQFWLRRVWQALAVFSRGPEGAREVVRTRCERGADIARMLGFTKGVQGDSAVMGTTTVRLEPITQVNGFTRHTWANMAQTAIWLGVARQHGNVVWVFPEDSKDTNVLVYGAELSIPLSERFAVTGSANLITPAATGTVDAFLGVSFFPKRSALRQARDTFAPVHTIANNPTMAIDLRR